METKTIDISGWEIPQSSVGWLHDHERALAAGFSPGEWRRVQSKARQGAHYQLAEVGAPPAGTLVFHDVEGRGVVLKRWRGDAVRVHWAEGGVSAVFPNTLHWQGKPPVEEPLTMRATGLGDIELKPLHWLVKDIWTTDGFGAVAGPEKSLKSYWETLMAMSVSTGHPFLNEFEVKSPGPVLFFAGEGSQELFKRRVDHLAQLFNFSDDEFRVLDGSIAVIEDVAQVQTERFQSTLAEWLAAKPALVVLDPFYAFHGAVANAGNVYETAPVLQSLSVPCHAAGVALQVVFHYRKGATGHDLQNITQAGPREWCHNWVTIEKRREPTAEEMLDQSFELEFVAGSREGYSGYFDIDITLGPLDEHGFHEGKPTLEVRDHEEVTKTPIKELVWQMMWGNPLKLTKSDFKSRIKGNDHEIALQLDLMVQSGEAETQKEKREIAGGKSRTVDVYRYIGVPDSDDAPKCVENTV